MKSGAGSVDRETDPIAAVPHAKAVRPFIEPAGAYLRMGRLILRVAHSDLLLAVPPVPPQLSLLGRDLFLPGHRSNSFRPAFSTPGDPCSRAPLPVGQRRSHFLRSET